MNGWVKRWAVIGLLLTVSGAYAGEPPPFRETARVTLGQRFVEEVEPMAATQHVWQSTNGVWSDVNSWQSGQIPGAGGANLDTALFDGKLSQYDVHGETPGGNALAKIVTTPAYHGSIGTISNPLIVDVSSQLVLGNVAVFRGTGNVYFQDVAGNHTDVVVDTRSSGNTVYLLGPLRNVFVKSGKCITTATATMASLSVLGDHANVVVQYVSDLSTDVWVTSGYLEMWAGSTQSLIASGGRVLHTGLLKDTCNLTVEQNAKFTYAPRLSVTGHNPDLYLLGGTFEIVEMFDAFTASALVISPDAEVRGTVVGRVGGGSGLATSIDLREDYTSVP